MSLFKKLLVALLPNRQDKTRQDKTNETFQPRHVNSILFRPLGYALGDAVVHTAHLKQLKSAFPQAKIGVLVSPTNQAIFAHCPVVDQLIPRKLRNYLKQRKQWDLLLDFENNFNSSSLFADLLLKPKWIWIFRKYNKKHYNLNNIKNYDYHSPQADNSPLSHYLNHSFLAEIVDLPAPCSDIQIPEKTPENITALWPAHKIRLLLCPQGSKRQIPPQELATFLRKAISEDLCKKVQCLLSYTATANEYAQTLCQAAPEIAIQCSPKTSLTEFFSLIASSDFVIAVDGGSLHLACAFNKPLISFFANCEPNLGQWTPLFNPNLAIPHYRILTKEKIAHSNNTKDFDMEDGINWFKTYLHKISLE
ncbi:glycosyltransferase family 9 protein [Lonepinella sp. BR2474]|uniref:glycosyltransferase family 9 protein n=1 Tax=Lonepinella sp. BR2474 TaxID=3434548 RepID=UPI003F6E1E44